MVIYQLFHVVGFVFPNYTIFMSACDIENHIF